MKTHSRRRLAAVAGAFAVVALLAACGNSGGSSGNGGTNQWVGTSAVGGIGTVLVDPAGKTLYFTDQDKTGHFACTGQCLGIWLPDLVPGATLPGGTMSGISVLARPDGQWQLAYQGKPLYEFRLDAMAGQVNGNGQRDKFGDMAFTWHAAVVAGTAVPGGNSAGNIPAY
jgi:predicted lipoprotein with Yx(FWY)xxD motif